MCVRLFCSLCVFLPSYLSIYEKSIYLSMPNFSAARSARRFLLERTSRPCRVYHLAWLPAIAMNAACHCAPSRPHDAAVARSSPALVRSCTRKRLLFVGDSSLQELMWELIFLTSCGGDRLQDDLSHRKSCIPISQDNLPVKACANQRCVGLAQNWTIASASVKSKAHRSRTTASTSVLWSSSSAKAHFRCFSMNACSHSGRAIFEGAQLPFHAEFLWSGNAGVLQKGGGLSSSIRSVHWLEYFSEVTGRDKAPLFDAVIFTAGLHDSYRRKFTSSDERVRAQAMQEYDDTLADVLARLASLAPVRLFLSMERRGAGRWARPPLSELGSSVHPAVLHRANVELERRRAFGGKWTTVVDATQGVHGLTEHCAVHKYNSTHIGYNDTTRCRAFANCVGMLACSHTEQGATVQCH